MFKVCLGNGEDTSFHDLDNAKSFAKHQASGVAYEIVDVLQNKIVYTSQDAEDEADYSEALIGSHWAEIPKLLEMPR